jgi:signal transduction histidine kinase
MLPSVLSRRPIWLALWPAGVAFGVFSVAIAHNEPTYSFGGRSSLWTAAELVAGWTLLTTGLIAWTRRPTSRFGVLLAATCFAWLLAEWNNPGAGSALVFTLGLALFAAAAPLVAHAALAFPGGRVISLVERCVLGFAYAGGLLVLGLLPTLVFDPAAQGCTRCPHNLLLLTDSPERYEDLNRIGVQFGLVWTLAAIMIFAVRLVRSTPPMRRLTVPVLLPAGAYLALVAVDFAHSLDRGFLANDALDRRLWLGQAGALVALSLGVVLGWLRDRHTRATVARLVVELAESPAPANLRDVLANTLRDPSLELAYRLTDGRLVDARGRPAELGPAVTPLVRGRTEVAFLGHRPGLLDDPGLAEEVAGAARLALENERLQAEVRARLQDLRASRARIVAAEDAERRRLERDLHDGAQQRLVSLSLSLRLLHSRIGSQASEGQLAKLDQADAELRTAVGELRTLAHGIYPAALTDEGLSAAIEALAEGAPVPMETMELLDERLDPAVEATAYFVVSEIAEWNKARALRVGIRRADGVLVVDIESDGDAPEDLVDLEDRVGALDGRLEVERGAGHRRRHDADARGSRAPSDRR